MQHGFLRTTVLAAWAGLFSGSVWACTAPSSYTARALSSGAGTRAPEKTYNLIEPAATKTDESAARTIVGLWDMKVYDGKTGAVVDEAYEQFQSDGTELMTDTSAPATDNVCIGIFTSVGNGIYKLKHVSFAFDLSGNLQATVIFRTVVTVDPKGNTFQGVSEIWAYDLSGNLLEHDSNPVKATRITVDF